MLHSKVNTETIHLIIPNAVNIKEAEYLEHYQDFERIFSLILSAINCLFIVASASFKPGQLGFIASSKL